MNTKIPVAILGATGTVGQKFITLLQNHPWFDIAELAASERSAGKTYAEAARWKQNTPIPPDIAGMKIIVAGEKLSSPILFSGMDSSVAGTLEEQYAKAGHVVISNARNHRMDPDVPIVIPEINPDHFELTRRQNWDGAIVTNPNCVIIPTTMVLAPLHRRFGIKWVQLTSMQAISGAGYPGVSAYDILGNVIPFIDGEEPKVEAESLKILGTLNPTGVEPASFAVSAQCNRVPVVDGHLETLSIKFETPATPREVALTLGEWRAMPQKEHLPSAPEQPVVVFEQEDRPQPLRDIWTNRGMSACVGRIRSCPIGHVKMVVLGHNTVRGAAGAAILNAEAYVHLKYYTR